MFAKEEQADGSDPSGLTFENVFEESFLKYGLSKFYFFFYL